MHFKIRFRPLPFILKNLILATGFLFIVSFALQKVPDCQLFGQASLFYFLPGLSIIFMLACYLGQKLGKALEQPTISVFIGTMGFKILLSMILLLVYLFNRIGPQIEGALTFMGIYLVFEILEIKRFLSILRPNSEESTHE